MSRREWQQLNKRQPQKPAQHFSDFKTWATWRATVDDAIGRDLKQLFATGWSGDFLGKNDYESFIAIAIDKCNMSFKDIGNVINDCPCFPPVVKDSFAEVAKVCSECGVWY